MARDDNKETSRAFSHLILWTILICLALFLVVANFLKVDVVTRGVGKVIPSKHLQIVGNLEGGIIKAVYVKAGDIVKKDQILVQFDDVRFKSDYEVGKQKEVGLLIRVTALDALATNKPFVTDKKLQSSPAILAAAKSYYINKKEELRTLNERFSFTKKEIDLTRPLVKEGVMSTVELLRLERDLATIQGAISNWYATVLAELNEANDKLAQVVAENTAIQDRLRRTTVRAPLYGIVKEVYVHTIGGVVKPDDPLVEIVPLDDTLRVEALVDPSHIGFVQKGLPAQVKISAYDYTIYGQLKGYVEYVSADSFKDEKGVTFYKIWVRTYQNYIELRGKKYQIFPGMEASVDILTGKRTLMHYILKPFMRVKESALIER